MAKFLLLLALGIVVYLIVSRIKRDGERPEIARRAPPPATPEDMVRCSVCGVHLPRSESFTSRGQFFCSDEHRRVGVRED
ncbi:MAG TPA: PP0621 family protein [Burkholderiales bacterium]|nr:PP0621 family protein [Burkholderiales bacterium]